MPNDVITLNALTKELNLILIFGRIDKITQPEKDEITFTIRAEKTNYRLVISANPNNPRLHLTSNKKDNPYIAPPFVMLLRKYLSGARIEKIALFGNDRIIKIETKGKNDLRDEIKTDLIIEMIGRYSNIILTNGEGYIIDAIKHIPPTENRRSILPKLKYELPEQSKLSVLDSSNVLSTIKEFKSGRLFDYLFQKLSGFAASTLNEILYRAKISPDAETLTDEDISALCKTFDYFVNIPEKQYLPALSKNAKGNYDDYYVFPYQYVDKKYIEFELLNQAIDLLVSEKDKGIRLKAYSKDVILALKNAIQKTERNIKHARENLETSKDNEKYKLYGELINANLYRIKRGTEKIALTNYYDNTEITINLNPTLSPQENAQKYYKKYAKLKRTHQISSEILKDKEILYDYLMSIQNNLVMAEDISDIEEIKTELIKKGILASKPKSKKVSMPEKSAPAKYIFEDFTILRGKNNIQNEKLTFKTAKDNDIWLHVKAYHGSHVIILTENKDVHDSAIETAAKIAAHYSDQRANTKVEVDYTYRKYVKKHPSNNCGMVTYTNYKTIIVEPESKEYLQEK